nr:bromodomain adjacent to zinc finger domain protein 1A-like [Lytechinus pictus]
MAGCKDLSSNDGQVSANLFDPGPAKKFASKPAKKENPKSQPKAEEKTGSRSRSQSRGRQSRQNTPEPSQSTKASKKDSEPVLGASGKKGQQSAQDKKGQQSLSSLETRGRSKFQEKGGRGSSLERRGQKRSIRMDSTDSESSQEEVQKKRNSGKALFKVALNGSMNADDSASDSSGPSAKNRRSSSGRGRGDLTQINKCEALLKELIKHPDARPFLNAVSKKAAPDYYRIIKRPMDFSAMQTKVNDYQYSNAAELIADARLIFTNCQQYNRRSSPEYKAGLKVSAFLEKRIKELDIEVSLEDGGTADTDTPTSRKRSRQR